MVWLAVGGAFHSEPLPTDTQAVSLISAEEFAALSQPSERAPSPVLPEPPSVPEPVVTRPPEARPEAPRADPPVDQAAVPPDPPAPPAPAERVAPKPQPAPEPEVSDAPELQEAIAEDQTGAVEATPQEAAAPPESTTEIVTEADEVSTALSASLRPPRARPSPPVETAAPDPEPAPAEVEDTPAPRAADPLSAAIAEALERPATRPVPTGQRLSGRELEGLRVSVERCWNVGTLSSAAADSSVTVLVYMNPDGTPDVNRIEKIAEQGGDAQAIAVLFRSARSAITRCRSTFDLPPDKYEQWKEIEMTFKPEGLF